MLTFRFTGVKGEMVEPEMLVSGMVGRQIRFEFSEEWDGLKKTAVYRAGSVTCTSEDIAELDVIPAKVLKKALRRLYVGVRGESEDGQVVFPTVFVPGPFIHIGASDSPQVDPEDPDWKELLENVVRCTPQNLTQEQKAQARANIGVAGGISPSAVLLLMEVLQKAVFTEDVSQTLELLEKQLSDAQSPEDPDILFYTLSCGLEHVTAQPASAVLEQGQSCTVLLAAEKGYVLSSVKVTMAGTDITASAYAGGKVTIGSVTGNVVITAKAHAEKPVESGGIFFVVGSVFDNVMNKYVLPSNRISMVTSEVVADTPFPQSGAVYDGDLYLLPVPAGANRLTVESPGLIGGPQFFTLEDGVYTCRKDAGWQEENGFTYGFDADVYDFVAINFKNSDNSAFYTEGYDTSGITAEFSAVQIEEEEPQEPEKTEVSVTLSLTRSSATNNQRTIALGERYVTLLVPADGYTITSVSVTMGGQDVTDQVYHNRTIDIPAVTGAIFVSAAAMRGTGNIVFMSASASATALDLKVPRIRMCGVTLTGEVPFPQNGMVYSGNLYPVPVPEGATALNVTCPGLLGGVQFYNLEDGAYVSVLDTGWQSENGFRYEFPANTYGFCIVNFKNSTNTEFFTADYDTSGIQITIE